MLQSVICNCFGEDERFVSNLCEQVVNKLARWMNQTTKHWARGAEPTVYGLKTLFFSFSIKMTLRHLLQCWRLCCNLVSIWLLFGLHPTYHDKKHCAGAQGLYKETQRGLNWDCDWHPSHCRREGCNQGWLCVVSGSIHRSLKKKSGTTSELQG